jgi:hypothetical protein
LVQRLRVSFVARVHPLDHGFSGQGLSAPTPPSGSARLHQHPDLILDRVLPRRSVVQEPIDVALPPDGLVEEEPNRPARGGEGEEGAGWDSGEEHLKYVDGEGEQVAEVSGDVGGGLTTPQRPRLAVEVGGACPLGIACGGMAGHRHLGAVRAMAAGRGFLCRRVVQFGRGRCRLVAYNWVEAGSCGEWGVGVGVGCSE